jgi:hypothetical protein
MQSYHIVVFGSVVVAYPYSRIAVLGYQKRITPIQRAILGFLRYGRVQLHHIAAEITDWIIRRRTYNKAEDITGRRFKPRPVLSDGGSWMKTGDQNKE